MNQKIHGLKENLNQFVLLVIVNAFVGGMVGLERTVFPLYAQQNFNITSHSAILSFISAFGFSKAIANYFTGKLANKIGRKNILIMGWLIAFPIPWIFIHATEWSWVVLANVLLGVSQGFTWSSTVVMKIDLVGDKERGLAMGINEFAGYCAVGLMAFATGYLTQQYTLVPYAFYPGIVLASLGLVVSIFLVQDTRAWVSAESIKHTGTKLKHVFWDTTYRNKILSSVTQAGLVNNLNDGMIWGLLPILLLSRQYSILQVGMITALYPMVWGMGQLFTGKMADHYSKKNMLTGGMLLQAAAIMGMVFNSSFVNMILCAVGVGIGTALVYPTFMVVIASVTHPDQRAESLGVFRLWRDAGYAFGAIGSGLAADLLGIHWAIGMTGALTCVSAFIVVFRYREK